MKTLKVIITDLQNKNSFRGALRADSSCEIGGSIKIRLTDMKPPHELTIGRLKGWLNGDDFTNTIYVFDGDGKRFKIQRAQ